MEKRWNLWFFYVHQVEHRLVSFGIFLKTKHNKWRLKNRCICFLPFDAFRLSGSSGSVLPNVGGQAGTHGESRAGRGGASGPEQGEESSTRDAVRAGAVWWPPGKSAVTWQVPTRQERRPGLAVSRTATPGQPRGSSQLFVPQQSEDGLRPPRSRADREHGCVGGRRLQSLLVRSEPRAMFFFKLFFTVPEDWVSFSPFYVFILLIVSIIPFSLDSSSLGYQYGK